MPAASVTSTNQGSPGVGWRGPSGAWPAGQANQQAAPAATASAASSRTRSDRRGMGWASSVTGQAAVRLGFLPVAGPLVMLGEQAVGRGTVGRALQHLFKRADGLLGLA